MLTSKQIKELPIGDYPNWRLMQMFPKQQGKGRSALIKKFKKEAEEGKKPTFFEALVNQFTGKFVHTRLHRKDIIKAKGN